MFDTHCHLFDKRFDAVLDKIIIDARESGVNYFMIPSTSLETSKQAIKIANSYDKTYCAVGIHPTEELVSANLKTDEMKLEELVTQKNVLAIGECGLDYYHFKSSPEIQVKFLEMHIKLAIKYDKALILHNRQSTTDIIKVLTANWQDSLRGKIIFHCASFEPDLIKFALEFDSYFGIDGDITYDKFKMDQVKKFPIERLLLETDSPYLLPEPLRSEKKYPNMPQNLCLTAEFVADLLSVTKEQLTQQTTRNAMRVFSLE